jgi:hypothetical protein
MHQESPCHGTAINCKDVKADIYLRLRMVALV